MRKSRAGRCGAHDYLAKDHADAYWLPRALRYVTDRKATEQALRTTEEVLKVSGRNNHQFFRAEMNSRSIPMRTTRPSSAQ